MAAGNSVLVAFLIFAMILSPMTTCEAARLPKPGIIEITLAPYLMFLLAVHESFKIDFGVDFALI